MWSAQFSFATAESSLLDGGQKWHYRECGNSPGARSRTVKAIKKRSHANWPRSVCARQRSVRMWKPPPTSTTSVPSPSPRTSARSSPGRSEEHTPELQSRGHLVSRLLVGKDQQHDS